MAFGSLEHRTLLLRDAATQFFGSLRLGATALALFADGALVQGQGSRRRLGVGLELKNALHLGPLTLTHALGWAQPLTETRATSEVYYRLRAAVPF
jgi:hypothetical protein